MSRLRVSARGVGAIGALVGALIAVLAVKLQRPQNIYSDGEGVIGLDGGIRTLAHIPPLPIWAWLLAAIVGGLLGYLIAVVGLKTIQRLARDPHAHAADRSLRRDQPSSGDAYRRWYTNRTLPSWTA